MRILIVDDDQHIGFLLSRLLAAKLPDSEIEVYDNSFMAAQVIAEEEPFDLIIIDREMKDIKGEVLISQAQRKSVATKCLMVTGNELFSSDGTYRLMRKPILVKEILRFLKE